MARNRSRLTLSCLEARRAVYIDFEGREMDPPTLLGILYARDRGGESGDLFEQHVLEALFYGAADARYLARATRPPVVKAMRLADSVRGICEVLLAEDRLLVAWSTHELTVIEADIDCRPYLSIVRDRYRDAKETARRWLKTTHPGVEFPRDQRRGRHRLEEYLKLYGYRVPSVRRSGNTGRRIHDIRLGLRRSNGDFEALTKVQKAKWTNLCRHNRDDCFGMCAVTSRAACQLEEYL